MKSVRTLRNRIIGGSLSAPGRFFDPRNRLTIALFIVSALTGAAVIVFDFLSLLIFPDGLAFLAVGSALLFFAVLVFWFRLRRNFSRLGRQPDRLLRNQALAFRIWFYGHSFAWAFLAFVSMWGMFRFFGPRVWVMAYCAGALACGFFALVGALIIRQPRMLALCWKSPVPGSLPGFWARAAASVVLKERYQYAADQDRFQLSPSLWAISRIYDRTKHGGADRGLDLMRKNPSKRLTDETRHRFKILGVLFIVTICIAILPGLFGLTSNDWSHVPFDWPDTPRDPLALKEGNTKAGKSADYMGQLASNQDSNKNKEQKREAGDPPKKLSVPENEEPPLDGQPSPKQDDFQKDQQKEPPLPEDKQSPQNRSNQPYDPNHKKTEAVQNDSQQKSPLGQNSSQSSQTGQSSINQSGQNQGQQNSQVNQGPQSPSGKQQSGKNGLGDSQIQAGQSSQNPSGQQQDQQKQQFPQGQENHRKGSIQQNQGRTCTNPQCKDPQCQGQCQGGQKGQGQQGQGKQGGGQQGKIQQGQGQQGNDPQGQSQQGQGQQGGDPQGQGQQGQRQQGVDPQGQGQQGQGQQGGDRQGQNQQGQGQQGGDRQGQNQQGQGQQGGDSQGQNQQGQGQLGSNQQGQSRQGQSQQGGDQQGQGQQSGGQQGKAQGPRGQGQQGGSQQGQGRGQGQGQSQGSGSSQSTGQGKKSSSSKQFTSTPGGSGAGQGSGGEGKSGPDPIQSEPKPLLQLPPRSSKMVTLDLPEWTPEGTKGKGDSDNPRKRRPVQKNHQKRKPAPTGEFKTGEQKDQFTTPEQLLPNWILKLLQSSPKNKNTQKNKEGKKQK